MFISMEWSLHLDHHCAILSVSGSEAIPNTNELWKGGEGDPDPILDTPLDRCEVQLDLFVVSF